MLDPTKEPLITLQEASKLPWLRGTGGGRVHVSTLWRWMNIGRNGHKLESIAIAHGRFTSEAAILRFLAAFNGEAPPAQSAIPDATDTRAKSVQAAEHVLAAAGI